MHNDERPRCSRHLKAEAFDDMSWSKAAYLISEAGGASHARGLSNKVAIVTVMTLIGGKVAKKLVAEYDKRSRGVRV